MGSPVANVDEASKYAKVVELRADQDFIGWPLLRSDENTGLGGLFKFITNPRQALTQDFIFRDSLDIRSSGDGGHSSYKTSDEVAKIIYNEFLGKPN
jgi:hypothetical protein